MDWPNSGQLFLALLFFLAAITVVYASICYGLKRLFFKDRLNFYRGAVFGIGLIWVSTIALSVWYPMGYQRIGGWHTSEKKILITAWERYWWSPKDRIIEYRFDKTSGYLEVQLGNELIEKPEVYAYTSVPGEIVKRMAESVAPTRIYKGEVKGRYGEQPLAR